MIGGCLFTWWVPSQQLRPGDRLTTLGGTAPVHSVTYTSARATVYNLTVSDVSNYLVGPDGVWVHNCGAGRHHLAPMYMGGDIFGATKPADNTIHNDIHNYINEAGRKYGIPPKQTGTVAFRNWYEAII